METNKDYKLSLSKLIPGLLQAQLQSRHSSALKYKCWVEHDHRNVTAWYCLCKVGARVVGTCSHVASVIWYLGVGRHENVVWPTDFSSYIKDAATRGEE
ncbi:hypothetical protein MAR_001459 [Mya arenaria]|uniref:SWIM-type domain-containing protein n=1 Tax=Mya arenaria TaxID=6604 RepID=A0ABY7FFB2_MYAAR|nr:hypothetical protein MAR_001459 [Mya arenaria]